MPTAGRTGWAALSVVLAAGAFLSGAVSANAFVYWTSGVSGGIGRAEPDGTGASSGFIGSGGPTHGVAVDGGHIYWANSGGGTIGRANLDGSGIEPAFITGADEPSGVTVGDGHLYWTNEGSNTIGRANLDGSAPSESFVPTGAEPDGVALDSTRLFWANKGGTSIGSAKLEPDGSIVTGSVSNSFITGASEPSGVATDGTSIYWSNTGDGSVGKASTAGLVASQSFITGLNVPTGVAVDASHLYWVDSGSGEIGRSDLGGGGVNTSFIAGLADPDGLAVDANVLPPSTSIGLSPSTPTGEAGWYRSAVQVTVSGAPGFYPLAATGCGENLVPAPNVFTALPSPCGLTGAGASISGEGSHVLYAGSEDDHGNAGPVVSAAFKIDTTPPTVSCSGAPRFAEASHGATVLASVADTVSGPAQTSVGASVSTSSPGLGSVRLTGRDVAGNTASISCQYTVGSGARPLSPRPVLAWKVVRAKGGSTRFVELKVSKIARGASVSLSCKGRGCPFSAIVPAATKRLTSTRDLLALLRGDRFHPGTRLRIAVAKKGTIGRAWILLVRGRSKRPQETVGCTEPGSSVVHASCS